MFGKLNPRYKRTTTIFWRYHNIALTLYLEIVRTENLDLLVVEGSPSDDELATVWEEIVKINSEANGTNVSDYEDDLKTYAKLLSDYELVRLTLIELTFIVDDSLIAFLESKGYKIDRSTATTYRESLTRASQRSRNIITKLRTKYNEIKEFERDRGKGKIVTIEEILANISAEMKFHVGLDITLARFNEYKKIIKRKNEKRPVNITND